MQTETKILTRSKRRRAINQQEIRYRMSIQAVRTLFHAACPHPIHYRDDESGEYDTKRFMMDLQIWISLILAMWITMSDTMREYTCECCISLRQAATNYEDKLKMIMTHKDFHAKRVSKSTIIGWAEGISTDGAKQVFDDLKDLFEAIIMAKSDPRIEELTTDFSAVSDMSVSSDDDTKAQEQSILKDELKADDEHGETSQIVEEHQNSEEVAMAKRKRKAVPRPIGLD
ncbi:uncharacterized protein LOC124294987 [Neodiprion lecontei]|uniref:Uncharacterized protein LOC124294987 n=1 Tax=Neodiprion lecontei TaxID=441921 RepID=A0ABM3GEU9_NEOLC|nr:uncharacterized protein LOC124294987 [Neodiprion lecontei]XP_046598801.1 uncharacterized protein LOC124294987 [Neodiprion lecontei]XP_046598802.1 uncharacterized protein LOC124294987 [Neodiprion lecontei]